MRLAYDFLAHVSRCIINEVPGISRVTYDIFREASGHDRPINALAAMPMIVATALLVADAVRNRTANNSADHSTDRIAIAAAGGDLEIGRAAFVEIRMSVLLRGPRNGERTLWRSSSMTEFT